jgi:hypothetical protein
MTDSLYLCGAGAFWPSCVRWRKLDVNKMVEVATGNRFENGRWEENPDLSKVDEIGFTDMMQGSVASRGLGSRRGQRTLLPPELRFFGASGLLFRARQGLHRECILPACLPLQHRNRLREQLPGL